jgi:hypothetical protein
MPKKTESKKAVGIPESVYLEMEAYAKKQKPELFLYEVIVEAWEKWKAGLKPRKTKNV